jgi:hypothetical protein
MTRAAVLAAASALSLALAASAVLPGAVFAADTQIDMASVQKWSNAKTVHFRIDGAYRAWTSMSPKWAMGEGDASDSATIDFDWDVRAHKVIGKVTFTNGGSSVGATRSTHKECPAPVVKGAYEHLTIKTIAQDDQPRLMLKGARTFAAVEAPLECPASLKLMPAPGSTVETTDYVAVPEPMMLAVGATGNPNLTVAKDHKTFVLKSNGWAWTYTPTLIN